MTSLIELRVLEGPNLYFPRAAIKLTLDISPLASAPTATAERLARRIGLPAARPGEPDTGFRQRFALRAVARLVRAIAHESGAVRLAVRVRPTTDPHVVVVAYPWRHRERAEEMGRAVAAVLDAVPGADVEEAVGRAAERVAASPEGPEPHTITPEIPVVAVTGTNGKTTTSRMIAHIARTAGQVVGWSNTDGIYLDGELVEAGDYSGPSGAGTVLGLPGVEFAVTETARGGILLKGIGLTRNDVSVVTNVSADHLGLQGIDTLDQLAEVKAVVPRITRRRGWAVLNGDDPRVFAMRSVIQARPWVFSRDPNSPAIRETLDERGRATTVIDGWVSVLRPGRRPRPPRRARRGADDARRAVPVQRREHAGGRLGRAGRRDPARDRGRGAAYLPPRRRAQPRPDEPVHASRSTGGEATVVIDLAHNEAGLEALLEIMAGVRPPGGRLLLGLGAVGDRTDELLGRLGEIGAMGADVAGHRSQGALPARPHARRARRPAARRRRAGRGHRRHVVRHRGGLPGRPGRRAWPGDVVGLMCHAQREEVYAWIDRARRYAGHARGARAKVRAATA